MSGETADATADTAAAAPAGAEAAAPATMATSMELFQAAMMGTPSTAAASAAAVQMSRSVHVGNLAATVTPDVLRTVFGCLGTIVDLRVGTNGKYCFIDFDTEAAAQAAMSLNGTGPHARARRAQARPHAFSAHFLTSPPRHCGPGAARRDGEDAKASAELAAEGDAGLADDGHDAGLCPSR